MPRGELLVEVRCEEIPARMLAPAIRQLGVRLFEELTTRGLGPKEVLTGFTPRRLAVAIKGLSAAEPDRQKETLGPPAAVGLDEEGRPTRAAAGFARRCGVEVDELRRVSSEKGDYLAAVRKVEGRPTRDLVAELAPRLLREISWAKTMRWGSGEGPWVRPVLGVVALFEGEVVPFELFGVASGAETAGHPIHSPATFQVKGWADYKRKLARRGIVVVFDDRRAALAAEMERLAAAAGGRVLEDPELMDTLTAICGIPGVVEGSIDPDFLELPREVLIASLRDHQSALPMLAADADELLPRFLTVMDRADDPAGRVRAGNEWVAAARLADAGFFFAEDRKRSLAEVRPGLERLSFHEELGSYLDKSERLEQLTGFLCRSLGWDDETEAARRAAHLAKADLDTSMVREFTALQGVVGGLYARLEGEPEAVWQAIYDQYLPGTTEDPIPRGRAGRVLALADRIDTLVGLFGLGHEPTGSRDPFGLRRAAQGVVRIALESELAIDLDLVAAKAFQFYGDRLKVRGREVLEAWRPFLFDRVRHLLGLRGFAYDEIEAALAAGGVNLPELAARVEALHEVRGEPAFREVVLAAKRIANIVKGQPESEVDAALFTEEAERDLHAAYRELRGGIERAEADGDYVGCLRRIGGFAEVLDRFFVEVLVMDENRELRNNRIGLLQSIQRVLSRTAGLTEMVVDRGEARQTDAAPRGGAAPRGESNSR